MTLTAEQVWWARFERAKRDVPVSRANRILKCWHQLMCIGADYEGAGFTPGDADHQERERLRVLSQLGEMHGIGPFPAPRLALSGPI
jgi:hypothetical protein